MAKPRTFVSSTCLDLKDARAAIEEHLKHLGHEPLLSNTLTFGVTPKKHSHQACLDQVDNSDYFILIIGSRRGGTYIGTERSITNEEYRRAVKRGIPVMTFVSEEVLHASDIYKKNPRADLSDVVDDVRIFDFVDLIRSESEDNWVRPFKTVEDIKRAITAQLAYICLCYSQSLHKSTDKPNEGTARPTRPFPKTLKIDTKFTDSEAAGLNAGLRSVHSVISKLQSAQVSGKEEKLKVIWLLGRYGKLSGDQLVMNFDRFKQYAFGAGRAHRVFTQLRDFGILAEMNSPDEDEDLRIELSFRHDSDGQNAASLKCYIEALLKRHSEDDALALFKKADMSAFT